MLCKSNSQMCEVILVQQHFFCCTPVQHHLVRSYIEVSVQSVKCQCKGVLCHLVWWGNGTLLVREVVQYDSILCEMIFAWQHGDIYPQTAKDTILTQRKMFYCKYFSKHWYGQKINQWIATFCWRLDRFSWADRFIFLSVNPL